MYLLKEVLIILIPFNKCFHPVLLPCKDQIYPKTFQLLQPTHLATYSTDLQSSM